MLRNYLMLFSTIFASESEWDRLGYNTVLVSHSIIHDEYRCSTGTGT